MEYVKFSLTKSRQNTIILSVSSSKCQSSSLTLFTFPFSIFSNSLMFLSTLSLPCNTTEEADNQPIFLPPFDISRYGVENTREGILKLKLWALSTHKNEYTIYMINHVQKNWCAIGDFLVISWEQLQDCSFSVLLVGIVHWEVFWEENYSGYFFLRYVWIAYCVLDIIFWEILSYDFVYFLCVVQSEEDLWRFQVEAWITYMCKQILGLSHHLTKLAFTNHSIIGQWAVQL